MTLILVRFKHYKGNILVEDKTERVVLLDYEFSGDNYRGYDIGKHG